ncbi:MAG: PAS domain S-box protein [Methanomicrobiales archaeon]|nr:PAS domain S-box protein [Methanomicrobiales archaeon]
MHKDCISVLYVEDEENLLEIGKIFLEKNKDIRVDISFSAQQALEALHTGSYDAVISDYQMPEMDGITFLQEVRRLCGDIPFILFTGRGREEIVIQAINNGVDFYLQKGGDLESLFAELAHKIKQAVKRKQAERSVRESEKRFYDIIDFLPDPTFAVDTSGRIIAWNRAIEEITGILASQIMGLQDKEVATIFYKKEHPVLIHLIDEPDEIIEKFYSQVRRTGNSLTAETDLIDRKGNTISALIKVGRFYDEKGNVSGAIESIRDITELKKAIKDLWGTVEELGLAQKISHTGFWEYNPGAQVIRCSAEAYSMFGYPPDSKFLTVKQVYSCIPEYERVSLALHNLIEEDAEYDLEYMVIPADDSPYRIVHSLARSEKDDQGDIIRVIGVIQDITRRKQVEEEVIFKNLILSTQQEVSPDAILIVDTHEKILDYNQNFVTLWNIPPEILASKCDEPVLMHVAEQVADPESFLAQVRHLYSQPEEQKFEEILLKNGGTIERFTSPMIGKGGKNFGRVWFFRDITERKHEQLELELTNQDLEVSYEQLAVSEKELQKRYNELLERERTIRINETRLLMAQEIGHTGCWEYDVNTDKIWGSAEGLSMFGFPPVAGDLPIEQIENCIPEREKVHKALIDLLTKGQDYNIEYEINPADGSPPRFIHSKARLEKDSKGHGIRVMGVIQDITERKKGEMALKETNEALVLAQKIARVGSWIYEVKTGKVTCSEELLRVFGYEPGTIEMNLETIRAGIHPDDLSKHDTILLNAVMTGMYESEAYRIIYPDGSLHYVHANGSVEMDTDGTAVRLIGVCQDVTEEIRLEREKESALKQIQKNLAYLAILNDEIRNPLSIIVTYSELMNDSGSVDLINDQVERIDQMVNQLDKRWMESEKVLNAIRKHYNLHIVDDDECDSNS